MRHKVMLAATLFAGAAAFAAPTALFDFRPGEVTVGGEIGRRLDVSMEKILRHTDIEGAFAKHFKSRKEKPDEPGGFAGYGMLLDALVKGAAHGVGGDESVALKTRLLKELAAAQTTDGQITMFLKAPGFWDSHENAYMIQAFVRDWIWFGETNSLETAKRLADSLIARKAWVTLGTETAFNLLYGATREPRYLDYLKDVCFMEKPFAYYDSKLQVNGVQHVYTWLARAIGQMEYADLLGPASPADRARFGEPAAEALRRAQGPHLSVSGSITGTPRWGELWDASQAGLGKWGETCASAYLMRLCARMSEWDGRSVLFDLYERVMYNAFFSAQSADGLKYRYWTPFDERAAWWPRETYCCPNNFRRMVFEIPDAVFRRSDDGLAVCLYAPAELKAPGVTAKMETAYPEDGKVSLSVTMAPGVKTLRLRIPKWCEGARVAVGDETTPAAPGWFEVRRDFSAGVTVALDLPMPVRLVRGVRAQEGRVAVMRGPCVYSLEPELNGLKTHGIDLWDLDPTKPLTWKPAAHAVEATLRLRHRQRPERRVLLTRYCTEERLRTFFGLTTPGEAVADELNTAFGTSGDGVAEGLAAAPDGRWYYKPYEYEAWMLQRMCGEVRRGLTNVNYPGKFLALAEEPAAVWSATPLPGREPVPGTPDVPPHRAERPETARPLTLVDGLYDVGGEDIGYVRVTSANPPPRLFVGESRAEARNSDTNRFEQLTDMVADGPGRWRSAVPLALRYFRFAEPVAGEVSFGSQVDRREPAGGFACDDPRLVKTWRTGVETLRLCTRTFLVDGIKRDRLPWAGDLAVEILAQAYAFGDPEPVKRTLAAIGSGDPRTTGNVNGIAAFSMWWVVGHDLLQRYFDAADYLKLHYPRIRERMEELFTHEDARGFFARNLGWNFMDWTGRDGGQLRSEVSLQVIYFAALEAGARLADRVGDAASAAAWRARAERLKAAILAVGMDGTRHSRILAIALGLVDGETARRYAREIAAGDLPPTMTPYMSTFEVIALVKGGETEAALAKYEAVWGAMTDFGVDAYWEGWDAADGDDERYVFYGRPFGKSLCHAWGSGPAFLIPGVFLGVRPTADGWRSHEVRPAVPGFAPGAVVTVPTPAGALRVPFGRR